MVSSCHIANIKIVSELKNYPKRVGEKRNESNIIVGYKTE